MSSSFLIYSNIPIYKKLNRNLKAFNKNIKVFSSLNFPEINVLRRTLLDFRQYPYSVLTKDVDIICLKNILTYLKLKETKYKFEIFSINFQNESINLEPLKEILRFDHWAKEKFRKLNATLYRKEKELFNLKRIKNTKKYDIKNRETIFLSKSIGKLIDLGDFIQTERDAELKNLGIEKIIL